MKSIHLLLLLLATIALSSCKDNGNYLNFTAVNDPATITLVSSGSPHPIALQYSTDDRSNWKTYSIGESISLSSGETVYFKADSPNPMFSKDIDNYYSFEMSGTVAADGNVMSLLDETMQRTDVPEYAFSYLFYGCSSLIEAPELPATELDEWCYHSMFTGCSLTTPPALPATTMAEYCYLLMFLHCHSLTRLPELPATKLADYCYFRMFEGCSSLRLNDSAPGTAWKIPENVDTSNVSNWNTLMFTETGGTFQGSPEAGHEYYLY